ncbi:MAG TPA: LLM class flavin-dependent oxidoreductase [Ktedonobacteraceae bacterium]|jgi:alkanesulfonate monooxygenase SsuD/methylene tetrahydromethanopterin reductase-like flavin-dependent oxidoreductase (luciferase family)|nr:LLM class flavin-dependent oxidoreductase [Ktedonobacteraceae bacterium]
MKFGIDIPNFGGDYANVRLVAEVAHEAEEAGWNGFFVWDHIGANWGKSEFSDPWMLLTAIAMRTERMRLGPMVTPIPRRRPWKLAREVATLDQVSNGRVIFGVGLGEGEEYSSYHEPGDDRQHGEMLDEGLDILTGLWRGEPFSYDGKYYQVENVLHLPRPVQQSGIPIWVAGWWPNRKPMRRAARWDGVFPLHRNAGNVEEMTSLEFQKCLAFIRSQQTAEKASQPYDVVKVGNLPYQDKKGTDMDVARLEEYASAGVTWWLDGPGGPDETLDDVRQFIRKGPPRLK